VQQPEHDEAHASESSGAITLSAVRTAVAANHRKQAGQAQHDHVTTPAWGDAARRGPAAAATTTITTAIPDSRIGLSLVPKCDFANSVSGSGE